jgi:hypothetical protein
MRVTLVNNRPTYYGKDKDLAVPNEINSSNFPDWIYNGGDSEDINNWTYDPQQIIEEIELP